MKEELEKESEEMQKGMMAIPTAVFAIGMTILTSVVGAFFYAEKQADQRVDEANQRQENQMTLILVELGKLSTNYGHMEKQLSQNTLNIQQNASDIRYIKGRLGSDTR